MTKLFSFTKICTFLSVILVVGITVFAYFISPVLAISVPQYMSYQGQLFDGADEPVSDTVSIEFTMYDALSGGAEVWSETQTVVVDNGYFAVTLGSVNPLDIEWQDQYYITLNIDSDGEMTPRQSINTSAYAFTADLAYRTLADSSAPVSSVTGSLYFDTTDDVLKVYNGSSWVVLVTSTVPGVGDVVAAADNTLSGDNEFTGSTILATTTVSGPALLGSYLQFTTNGVNHLYFDNGTSNRISWNDSLDKFEITNDLDVTGTVTSTAVVAGTGTIGALTVTSTVSFPANSITDAMIPNTITASNYLAIANNLSDLVNAATARTNLGLGTVATLSAGAVLQSSNNLSDLVSAATARTNLGLAIGSNVQAFDADLATFAALSPSGFLVGTGSAWVVQSTSTFRTTLGLGTIATASATDYLQAANNLSDLANSSTARTNLGLGSIATASAGSYLAVVNNLSDLTNTSTARTNLGLGSMAMMASGDYLSISSWLSTTTDALDEGSTNLYFSDARARAVLSSSATGLTYTSSTGSFALTSGYVIPLSASTTDWQTAFGWGNHAVAGYLTTSTNLTTDNFASVNISQWVNDAGYITSAGAESDPVWSAASSSYLTTADAASTYLALSSPDITNWNTAYGWGDHSIAGYLTSLSGALLSANDLSDLSNTSTARTNLGLGSIATANIADYLAISGGTLTGTLIGTTVSSTNALFGTVTTTALSVTGINTSTFGGSINLPSGYCFAVDGTCITGGGGSGTVNSGTSGYLTYYPSTGTTVDDSGLFWDTSNSRLGIGTTVPSTTLHVVSTTEQLRLGYDASNYVSYTVGASGSVTTTVSSSSVIAFGNGNQSLILDYETVGGGYMSIINQGGGLMVGVENQPTYINGSNVGIGNNSVGFLDFYAGLGINSGFLVTSGGDVTFDTTSGSSFYWTNSMAATTLAELSVNGSLVQWNVSGDYRIGDVDSATYGLNFDFLQEDRLFVMSNATEGHQLYFDMSGFYNSGVSLRSPSNVTIDSAGGDVILTPSGSVNITSNLVVQGTNTSTFAGSIDVPTGYCFAVNGTCLSAGGGSGDVVAASNNTFTGTNAFATTTVSTSTIGALTISGNTIIGDALGDTVTSNAAAWTFVNDTTVALSGGVDGLNFDSNTLSIDATNNRVGIGTNAPSNDLHVASASTGATGFSVENTSSGGKLYRIGSSGSAASTGAGDFSIYDTGSSAYRFLIDTGGNIGIGDSTPTEAKLAVDGGSDFALYTRTSGQESAKFSSSAGYNGFRVQTDGANGVPYVALDTGGSQKAYLAYWGDTNGRLSLGYGLNTDVLTVDTSGANIGSVGIGDTTPDYLLDVAGTVGIDGALTIGDAITDTVLSHAGAWTFQNDTTVALTGGTNGLNFDSNTLSIDATNNRIGIGTAAPATALDVSGAAYTAITNAPTLLVMQTTDTLAAGMGGGIMFGGTYTGSSQTTFGYIGGVKENGTSGDYSGKLVFGTRVNGGSTADMTRMTLTSAGSLGIGDTTPDYMLDVAGTAGFDGHVSFGDAAGDNVTSNAAAWTFANDTTVALTGGVNGLNFDSNTLSIDATNNSIGIGTAAPQALLHINASNNDNIFRSGDTTNYIAMGVNSGTTPFFDFFRSSVKIGNMEVGASSMNFNNSTAYNVTFATGGGKVGVGTTVPDKALEINSATGAALRLTYNDSNGSAANYADFSMSSSGDLTIVPSGSDTNITGRMTLTDTAGGRFAQFNSNQANAQLGIQSTASGGASWSVGVSGTGGVGPGAGLHFRDESSGVTRMSITNAGLVGIGLGATGASAFLHVVGASEQVRIGYDTSNYFSTTVGNTGAVTFNAVGSGQSFAFSDGVTINSTLATTGNTTLGDASGDTVTSNAAAWTFANDTTVALTGGVNGLNFDSNTLSIDATNNRVGIGTAAPAYDLDTFVSQDAGTTLAVRNESTGTSARAMLLLANGSATTDQAYFLMGGTGYTSVSPWQDSLVLRASTGISGGIKLSAGAGGIKMSASSAYADDFIIATSGNVGIGTSAPATTFHVHQASTNSQIQITDGVTGVTSGDGLEIGTNYADSTTYIWNNENTALRFGTNNAERLRIDNAGNVGIGDITPDDLLNISSASAAAGLAITSLGTDTDPYIKFELADGTPSFIMGIDDSDSDKFKISTTGLGTSDRFVIDSFGNVTVGGGTNVFSVGNHYVRGNNLIISGSYGDVDTDFVISSETNDNLGAGNATFLLSSYDLDATGDEVWRYSFVADRQDSDQLKLNIYNPWVAETVTAITIQPSISDSRVNTGIGITSQAPASVLEIGVGGMLGTGDLYGSPESTLVISGDGNRSYVETYTTDMSNGLLMRTSGKVSGMIFNASDNLPFLPALQTGQTHIFSYMDPAYGFTDDGTIGDIVFSASTTEAMRIDYFTRNVGIGTSAPSSSLHIVDTTEQLRLGYDASNYTSFVIGTEGDLNLLRNGTSFFYNNASSLQLGDVDQATDGIVFQITAGVAAMGDANNVNTGTHILVDDTNQEITLANTANGGGLYYSFGDDTWRLGNAEGMNITKPTTGAFDPIDIGDTAGQNNTTVLRVDDFNQQVTVRVGTGDVVTLGGAEASDFTLGLKTKFSTGTMAGLSPTNAELEAAFGPAAGMQGYVGILDANANETDIYLVTVGGANDYWYTKFNQPNSGSCGSYGCQVAFDVVDQFYALTLTNTGDSATNNGIYLQAGADGGSGTTYYLDARDGDGNVVGYIQNSGGTFSLQDVSDVRTKTNIEDTDFSGLSVVNGLRVVDFNRVNNPNGTRITGFIAQEVSSIYPQAVSISSDGYYTLSKEAFVPILVKAIQEQQVQITALSTSLSGASGAAVLNGSFEGTLRVKKHVTFGEDTVGQAKILSGSVTTTITFAEVYEYMPIVAVTPVGSELLAYDISFVVTEKTTSGFTIQISQSQPIDVLFDWHAFASEQGRLFISDGTTQDIELVVVDEPSDVEVVVEESGSGSGGEVVPTEEEVVEPLVSEVPGEEVGGETGIPTVEEVVVVEEPVVEEIVVPEPETAPTEPAPSEAPAADPAPSEAGSMVE